jgi:hypothetical protein
MKYKKIILVAITVIATQTTYAQYLADALRFSQFQNSSTARFDGLGGYKSAIGGDLSSLYGNPAGVGMFTKSEFNLTPSLKLRNNDAKFLNSNNNGISSNIDLNNVGVVFHSKTYKKNNLNKGVISLNFGIGYQKRNSFKNDLLFNGTTAENGLGDYFAEKASSENATQNNLRAAVNGAAYDSFLIDEASNNPKLYFPITSKNANQIQTINRAGGSSSVDFSLGLNISNTVFVGAAVGLASFRYTSFEQTNERGKFRFNNQDTDYNVDYNRNFDTEGSGLNLKLGLILKPVNELRIGLSFETPTYFNVTDNYSEDLINNIDAIKGTDAYPFEYRLSTPVKANGGLAYFFGDKGFISADVGFVDYTSIKFSSGDSSTDLATNRNSRQDFQNVINYSLGGELRVQPNLMLRLGYQVQGNPYKNLSNTDFEIKSISGGFGYRFGSYYLDMSLVNSNDKLFYRNYSLENGSEPVANIDTKRNNVNLTFGVRF